MEANVIEDIGAAADELEEITERFIQSVGVSAVESRSRRSSFCFILLTSPRPSPSPKSKSMSNPKTDKDLASGLLLKSHVTN